MMRTDETQNYSEIAQVSEHKLEKAKKMIDINSRPPRDTNASLEMISLRDLILERNPDI